MRYTLSHWGQRIRYLDHPWLTPANTAAEHAIRPFGVGRKNWLFSGNPRGADASCAIYSVIETAKQNRMNPYAYLYLVFTKVPQIVDDGEWHALLPWNLTPDEINEAAFADLRFN